MSPGEIWFLTEPLLGESQHGHYVLVTALSPDGELVFFSWISTERWSPHDFRLDIDDPEFSKTGLKHTSHIQDNYEVRKKAKIKGVMRGFLEGGLLKSVEKWYGMPIK